MKPQFLKLLLLTLIYQVTFFNLKAQDVYSIEIILEGNADTTFYLANYYGDKFFITDTSTTNVGTAIFTGEERLKEGIYLLANKKKEKLIEFLVGKEQQFKIKVGTEKGPSQITVEGSIDNQLFFDHIIFVNKAYAAIQQHNSMIESVENTEEQKSIYRIKIDSINKSILDYRKTIIDQNPGIIFSVILSAMQENVIPVEIKDNQDLAYKYYKTHFWDGFDLSDDRLLITPLLPIKLKSYFDQLVVPEADSVIKEVDFLLNLTKGNQKMMDYLVWHFVSEYQTPKIMGLDKVFVHLVDRYFVTKKIENVTPSIEEKLLERANKMRLSLVGLKAPEMWLVDTTGNFRSFREITADYTVLIFWDQTCGHCKKEMEALYKLFQTKKYNLGVYAVNSTNDFEGWKHYLNEKKYPWLHVNGTKSMTSDFHDLYDIYSVPVIYLLDKNKTIIGKRIGAEQIEKLIDNFQQMQIR